MLSLGIPSWWPGVIRSPQGWSSMSGWKIPLAVPTDFPNSAPPPPHGQQWALEMPLCSPAIWGLARSGLVDSNWPLRALRRPLVRWKSPAHSLCKCWRKRPFKTGKEGGGRERPVRLAPSLPFLLPLRCRKPKMSQQKPPLLCWWRAGAEQGQLGRCDVGGSAAAGWGRLGVSRLRVRQLRPPSGCWLRHLHRPLRGHRPLAQAMAPGS